MTFGLALFLVVIGPHAARAEITFPTQIPNTSEALSAIIRAVPGLSAAGIKNFHRTANSASAAFKIKGEAVTFVVFKRSGISKVLLAIVPDDFKLSTFLPVPSGTPADGIKFKDMALVIVPKGAAKNGVSTSGLPMAVSKALSHSGSKVDFKAGLNLFGEADFTSSGAIKKVLSAVGHTQLTLPLNGAFSADVFKHDLKTASKKLKEELLVGLTLRLPLPRLRIPGMPNTVPVKNAHLAIVGREVKGKRKIFAGVTGSLNVRIGNKDNSFNFGILAGDPGKQWTAEISAESKGKITLPLIHPLSLTDLKLTATRKGTKWAVKVDAKSKLRSKPIDVSYVHKPDGSIYLDVKTKLTIADIVGQPNLPGLDDIQATEIQVYKKYWRVILDFKGTYGYVNIFKPQGASKHLVAVTVGPPTISPARFIPGTANSPLKDVDFKGSAFAYAPQGTAGRLYRNQMPRDIAFRLRPAAVPGNIVLKSDLNVFGKIEAHPTGELAKLLKDVGIHDLSHNLNGGFSPKVFAKNISGSAIRNEILDYLDIKVALPKLALPGISKVATIRHTTLAIKGVNKGGKRGIDVKVGGELDVRAGGQDVVFDFDVEVKKQAGKPSQIKFIGKSKPGKTVTINMIEKVKLENLSIIVLRQGNGWGWQLSGQAPFRSKQLTINLENTPNNVKSLSFGVYGMSLGEIAGYPNLPVLGDLKVGWIVATKNNMRFDMEIKGVGAEVMFYKPNGSSKYHFGFAMGDFSPTAFIPGTSSTPLKDASFKNLVFVYNPSRTAEKSAIRDLPLIFASKLPQNQPRLTFKPGLNVFGHLDIHPSGEMASLMKKVGVHDLTLPLNGGFSPKAFSKNLSGTAIKNAILDNLDLNIKLPALSVPGVSRFLTFKNGHLKIKGKTPSGARGIDVAISGDADVHVKGIGSPLRLTLNTTGRAAPRTSASKAARRENGPIRWVLTSSISTA